MPWPRLMCLSIATIDENGRVNTQSKSCQYLQQWSHMPFTTSTLWRWTRVRSAWRAVYCEHSLPPSLWSAGLGHSGSTPYLPPYLRDTVRTDRLR